MEAFEVEVLVVCHGGGDTPGDGAVMAEVGQPWHAWERQPHSIELGAREVILIEHIGSIERPVGVAGEQRSTTGAALANENPVIATTLELLQHAHHGCASAQRLQTVQRRTTIIQARGDDQRLTGGLVSVQFGGQLRSDLTKESRAPEFSLPHAPGEHMPDFEHGAGVPRLPGLWRGGQELILDRQPVCRLHKRIHACRVGVQHGAGLDVDRLIVSPSAGL